MEASEKQQLPLDGSAVRALDDRLVIESLTVTDERAARVVRERAEAGHDPARTVTDAIEVGARVLDREDLSGEVDYIRAEFERASGQLREQLTERAGELMTRLEQELERVFGDDDGQMATALADHADELAEQVARHFDPERQTAVQNQVRELVIGSLKESQESLVRHLSSDGDSNPLADFKRNVNQTLVEAVRHLKVEEKATRDKLEALQKDVVRLTEQAEARRQVAEAEEAGTRKGRTFEERVHDAIEGIAAARGDAARHVGDEKGASGSKKGDTVVEIGGCDGPAQGRIVFEDKDEQLSKNRAWEELNGAMSERDADFAVLVVAGEEKIPAGREQLVEYEGNKLIVAVDPELPDELALDLAYRYARLRLLLRREGELTLDAPGVRDAAEEARSALKLSQSIRLALSGIDKNSRKAREGLDGMVASVEERLNRIESLIAAAE
jgi:hypothetical protein